MKRFFVNLLWLIFALPFYVASLLLCGYTLIVLTAVGIVFDKTKPYNMCRKIDDYIYKQVKKYLII